MKKLGLFLAWVEDHVVLLATVGVLCIISLAAACRYLFSYNLSGSEEILGLFSAWMFFIGAIRASRTNSQITADILGVLFKGGVAGFLIRLTRITLGLVICATMAWWSVEFISWEIENGGTTPALGIPILIGKLALFLSFFGMAGYCLRDLANLFLKR
ncbi:TRAP transporter small permease [Ectopseudomonas mendocina]|uniref:TRAP transporter small permease n=1 Tax=Ectopseudomonas mendocina TaxID=300 RepID=UPI0023ED038A|nr:TRAP transporter small permease [Pseudomonas mendocina]